MGLLHFPEPLDRRPGPAMTEDHARAAAELAGEDPAGLLRGAFSKWANPKALLHVPPIWREGRWALELACLTRDPIFQGEGVVEGDGRPVLLVPGYLAGDGSMGVMADWLRRCGYRTGSSRIRANVGCTTKGVLALEQRLERLSERWGQRATVIGQSRGGMYARILAARRPDLVDSIVTLGSPCVDPLAVHPILLANIAVVGLLGTLGVPGLLTRECFDGGCCTNVWRELERPLEPDVRWISIYSRSDGVVDWHSCLAQGAEHMEVHSSHTGMGVNVEAYRIIADALAAASARASMDSQAGVSSARGASAAPCQAA